MFETFKMTESLFAEFQKDCYWFTLPFLEALPDVDPTMKILPGEPLWNDDILVLRHLFAMTFGGFGYSVQRSKAKAIALIKLGQIEDREPQNKSPNNPNFLLWLERFAQYNILLGTIYAYQHDYILAATLLMNGLKTRAVNLFMPYCDFIKYVLSKVEEMPAELVEYDGCGFSVDTPMGSIDHHKGILNPNAAEMIIPALEGENGEIILAHCGNQKYGYFKRLGSSSSEKHKHLIDVYEVLMRVEPFQLKKIRFYFDGYFTPQNRHVIRLPKGFRLDPMSKAAQIFQAVD